MIPNEEQIKRLWRKYHVPEEKRRHMQLVARVAMHFAAHIPVHTPLLLAAALLHDIDKNAEKLAGERHPDTAVRILREEGMDEVADVVVTHPLHAILDKKLAPKTQEQKILYLADKMVKYDIVGVDRRFALWNAEHLPPREQKILDTAYPEVKKLEQEVFKLAHLSPGDILNAKE